MIKIARFAANVYPLERTSLRRMTATARDSYEPATASTALMMPS
jgi:hypothetical protein